HAVAALDQRHRSGHRIVVERPPAPGTAAGRPAVLAHSPKTGAADQAVARRQQREGRSRPPRILSAMGKSARAGGGAGSVATEGWPPSPPRRGPPSNGTPARTGM